MDDDDGLGAKASVDVRRDEDAPAKIPINLDGYTQTYLIEATEPPASASGGEEKGADREDEIDDDDEDAVHEHRVLFRCGNWCYTGHVALDKKRVGLADIPRVIPMLQRQQNRLHYFCNAKSIPVDSSFRSPLEVMNEAQAFSAAELASEHMEAEIAKWTKVFTWMEDEPQNTYFELTAEVPEFMQGIALIASKTYSRGLIFILIYIESTFYIVIQSGEGDQPLLDVKFPDVSHHGQGVHMSNYMDKTAIWRKMTLWHSLANEVPKPLTEPPVKVTDLSTSDYMQMYMVMKARGAAEGGAAASAAAARGGVASSYRDVLFRFGSWCYSGAVQLTPSLALGDIPHVIPALRMQQSRLEFMCDVAQMPRRSPYTKPMESFMKQLGTMSGEIHHAETVLTKLVERLSAMGLGDSISQWLEGDATQSFFEFQLVQSKEALATFKNIELLAAKVYGATGVVIITIFFGNTFYVVLSDATGEQPLLDSRFPDVSSKGRGYQINAYPDGSPTWKDLRKVSIWQTASAMQLEMEQRLTAKGETDAASAAAGAAGAGADAALAAALAADDKADDKCGGGAAAASAAAGADAPAKGGPEAGDGAAAKGGAAGGEGAAKAAKGPEADDDAAGAAGKTPAADAAGGADAAAQAKKGPGPLSPVGRIARPHHLPSMGAGSELGDRLAQIRNSMSAEGSGDAAPWDAMGRPRGLSFKK